jgi:hypothetical protein
LDQVIAIAQRKKYHNKIGLDEMTSEDIGQKFKVIIENQYS